MPDAAHFFAEYTNYSLVAMLLAQPFLPGGKREMRTGEMRTGEFWLRSAAGIGLAVILAESGKRFQVWPGHPSFPSGHETLGLAAATALVLRDPRWLLPCLPLTALLGWALVAAHYHEPIDIAGALLTGPPSALLCQWIGRRT